MPKIVDRRTFIGGSDARIIMGNDELALLRLWQENEFVGEILRLDLAAFPSDLASARSTRSLMAYECAGRVNNELA